MRGGGLEDPDPSPTDSIGPAPPPAPDAGVDAAAEACTLLAVFDFDRTLLYAANSDEWVFEELAPDLLPLLYQRVRSSPSGSWTDAINWALAQLPGRGIPASALLASLSRLPWHPDVTALLRLLAGAPRPGVQAAVASDANAAYIDALLGANGMSPGGAYFGAGVWTNGAAVSPAGALAVVPFSAGRPPHGCARCPANMCKGGIVADLVRARPNVRRVVYVGDGSNDVCPVLQLGARDIALARQGYAMERELTKLRAQGDARLVAEVISWASPPDLLRLFRELLAA